jgi:hypothetical protein
MSGLYTIRHEQGAWEVVLSHCVKVCWTEAAAKIWATAWNEGRNPLPEEIAESLSRDWPKVKEGGK